MKIYFDNSGCAVHRYGYTDGRCTCRLGGEDALVINESIFAGAGLQGFLEAEKILSEAEKAAITKVWGRHANDAGEEYLFTDLACACRKGSIDPDAATAYLSGIFNGWDREVTFPPIYLAGGLDQVACVQKRPGIYANCQTDIGLAIGVNTRSLLHAGDLVQSSGQVNGREGDFPIPPIENA